MFSVNYKGLAKDLQIGDRILVNNGLVVFEVEEKSETEVHCRVIAGGELSNQKSMSFPGKVLNQEYLSDIDKADLLFGIKNDVDFVAASFVSSRADIESVRNFLDENGGKDIELLHTAIQSLC